jgi:hypothetical protein
VGHVRRGRGWAAGGRGLTFYPEEDVRCPFGVGMETLAFSDGRLAQPNYGPWGRIETANVVPAPTRSDLFIQMVAGAVIAQHTPGDTVTIPTTFAAVGDLLVMFVTRLGGTALALVDVDNAAITPSGGVGTHTITSDDFPGGYELTVDPDGPSVGFSVAYWILRNTAPDTAFFSDALDAQWTDDASVQTLQLNGDLPGPGDHCYIFGVVLAESADIDPELTLYGTAQPGPAVEDWTQFSSAGATDSTYTAQAFGVGRHYFDPMRDLINTDALHPQLTVTPRATMTAAAQLVAFWVKPAGLDPDAVTADADLWLHTGLYESRDNARTWRLIAQTLVNDPGDPGASTAVGFRVNARNRPADWGDAEVPVVVTLRAGRAYMVAVTPAFEGSVWRAAAVPTLLADVGGPPRLVTFTTPENTGELAPGPIFPATLTAEDVGVTVGHKAPIVWVGSVD